MCGMCEACQNFRQRVHPVPAATSYWMPGFGHSVEAMAHPCPWDPFTRAVPRIGQFGPSTDFSDEVRRVLGRPKTKDSAELRSQHPVASKGYGVEFLPRCASAGNPRGLQVLRFSANTSPGCLALRHDIDLIPIFIRLAARILAPI